MSTAFARDFAALTDHFPFAWQQALFERMLARDLPSSCDLPTGTGKTSVIPIWVLALREHVRRGTARSFPRRLVYVVNRRTVVDQATNEAVVLRQALVSKPELRAIADDLRRLAVVPDLSPIGISTLRGEFMDNAEWRIDPARASIIVGTVDMIGSRLLFSGYGCGFKTKPMHAGFLGQDVLLVHDEAHLEPAFQALIEKIVAVQGQGCWEAGRAIKVMALTATHRGRQAEFSLTQGDLQDRASVLGRRLHAAKLLKLHPLRGQSLVDAVMQLAKARQGSDRSVLCYLRRVDDVEDLSSKLAKAVGADHVEVLTGTMRGHERGKLIRSPVFARFMRKPPEGVVPIPGTAFLVCTSAGEVGIDISSDDLICDLTTFDSMAQRLGRVNRYGDGSALVDVLHDESLGDAGDEDSAADEDTPDDEDESGSTPAARRGRSERQFEKRQALTLALIRSLPALPDNRLNACPVALRELPSALVQEAFAPAPAIPHVSEILFDRWALTSIRHAFPGRPPVADWLHGIPTYEPPVVSVAWRREVDLLGPEVATDEFVREVLDDYPIKSFELLTDRVDRVLKHVAVMARRTDGPVWVVGSDRKLERCLLSDLVEWKEERLADATVVLSPTLGGLTPQGQLRGAAESTADISYDVADEWHGGLGPHRARGNNLEPPSGMRLVQCFEFPESDEGDAEPAVFAWFVRPESADDDGSRTSAGAQLLSAHLSDAEAWAARFAASLELGDVEKTAVVGAARMHDLGKRREVWQRSIRNKNYPKEVLAKGRVRPLELGNYRHELGSVLDIVRDKMRPDGDRSDLLLHIVAAHHGRARPCFPISEWNDAESPQLVAAAVDETPSRFVALQERFGRWGLAYLESIMRAADFIASAKPGVRP